MKIVNNHILYYILIFYCNDNQLKELQSYNLLQDKHILPAKDVENYILNIKIHFI